MKQYIAIITILLITISCGTQKQLQKSYTGKPVSVLTEEFGQPKIVLDREDGKIYIYEKTEELESTEISQHKLTLDPIVTPRVKKTERYYFTVADGKITDVKFEEEYER